MRLLPRFCATLSAVILLTAPVSASAPATSDVSTLSRLSNEWMSAVARKDLVTLNRLVASDFTLQMPGNQDSEIVRRDEWIANAIAMDWSDFRYENLAVTVRGDQATVTSKLRFNVSSMPITMDSGIVDLWEKRNGRWQVTNRYLGQSQVQLRIALLAGIVATLVAGLLIYGIVRLARRMRRRRAAGATTT